MRDVVDEATGLSYKTVANANGSGNLTWTVVDNGGNAVSADCPDTGRTASPAETCSQTR